MKLPTFRRINKNDYLPEQQGLVESLAVSINNGFEVLYEALNNKLNIRDNLACIVTDLTVEVDSTGAPLGGVSFNLKPNTKADALFIGKLDNLTNSANFPSTSIMLDWVQSNDTVVIRKIIGLSINNKYLLRIVAFTR